MICRLLWAHCSSNTEKLNVTLWYNMLSANHYPMVRGIFPFVCGEDVYHQCTTSLLSCFKICFKYMYMYLFIDSLSCRLRAVGGQVCEQGAWCLDIGFRHMISALYVSTTLPYVTGMNFRYRNTSCDTKIFEKFLWMPNRISSPKTFNILNKIREGSVDAIFHIYFLVKFLQNL